MGSSVRKIAVEAGVSPATVSRYMNGSVRVSDEIAGKIDNAIEKLGGEPLTRQTKPYVFILMMHMRFSFYGQSLKELFSRQSKYQFVLIHYDALEKGGLKQLVSRFHPVGVIYFEEEIDNEILDYMQKRGVRTVMVGGAALNEGSDMVHVNDLAAAYEGTNYLLRLGHRDILFLSDEVRKISSGFQRITGAKKALEENGLRMDEDLVYYSEVTFQAGYDAVRKALAAHTHFTAVFAFSDELAVGAMAALYDAGLSVPDDVSVLGFDDLEMAEQVRPALSTIRQPIDLFVNKAIELFDEVKQEPRIEILLRYSVRERGSCKALVC